MSFALPASICTEESETDGITPSPIRDAEMLKVSAEDPMFTNVNVWVPSTVFPPIPNPSEDGCAVTVLASAVDMFNSPAPPASTETGLTKSVENVLVLLISRDRYWRAVSPGLAAFSKAAAPLTIGADRLVPLAVMY